MKFKSDPVFVGDTDVRNIEFLKVLRVELSRKHKAGELDGYAIYLYVLLLCGKAFSPV